MGTMHSRLNLNKGNAKYFFKYRLCSLVFLAKIETKTTNNKNIFISQYLPCQAV